MNIYCAVLERAEAARAAQIKKRSEREQERLAKFLAGRDKSWWKRQGRRVVLR